MNKRLTWTDSCIENFDQALRTLMNVATAARPNPGENIKASELSQTEKKHVAGLMRIDHAGEVCAQALYLGHSLTARNHVVKEQMLESAKEEIDHLAWCQKRIEELNSHTSYLNPFWYVGSLAIGMLSGVLGDAYSLGFVAETEKQVEKHLEKHLSQLPSEDKKSFAILKQMQQDEMHHAKVATENGARELSDPIKGAMKLMSKIMTTIAYYV